MDVQVLSREPSEMKAEFLGHLHRTLQDENAISDVRVGKAVELGCVLDSKTRLVTASVISCEVIVAMTSVVTALNGSSLLGSRRGHFTGIFQCSKPLFNFLIST